MDSVMMLSGLMQHLDISIRIQIALNKRRRSKKPANEQLVKRRKTRKSFGESYWKRDKQSLDLSLELRILLSQM